MRTYYLGIPQRLSSLFVLVLLVACGGGGSGGGGGSVPSPPVISNLTYTPKAVYVNTGGGQVTVSGSFAFSGANGGIASVTIAVVDSVGTALSTSTTPVPGGSGMTSGSIQGTVIAPTIIVGTYAVRVTLTDIAGLTSNTLSGNFRITDNPWAAKAPMPNARQDFAVATSGGLAYVIGGTLLGTGTFPGPESALVDIYDPAANSWVPGLPLPTARKAPVAAAVNGVIYVIGGYNLAGDLSTVEAFDLMTSQWTAKTAMPTPRHDAAAAVINGQICVFGGERSGVSQSTTECFDPMANTWSAEPPMPTGRTQLGSDTIGMFAYAVGGYSSAPGPGYVKTAERFDIANQRWASVLPMSTERVRAGIVAASGLLFAIGGSQYGVSLASVEAFNPNIGSWISKTPMPLNLSWIRAVAIGGVIFVFEAGNTLQYTPGNDIL